jgi:hypothetical protein
MVECPCVERKQHTNLCGVRDRTLLLTNRWSTRWEPIARPGLACPPTASRCVSGIQKPALRRPRVNAGSQKRHDTAHAEVFCAHCLTRTSFFGPGIIIPRLFFSLNERLRQCKGNIEISSKSLLDRYLQSSSGRVSHSCRQVFAARASDKKKRADVAEHCGTMASVFRAGAAAGRGVFSD